MFNSVIQVPHPVNEPVFDYAPGNPARAELQARIQELASSEVEIPLVIGGKEVRTGTMGKAVLPHRHSHVVAQYHRAGPDEVRAAIAASAEARRDWGEWPWQERVSVFLRAAELLATRWRSTVNGATVLNQSKTPHQAEIDAACELIDFWRFNARYAQEIYEQQVTSDEGVWNWLDYRPLEGFIYAVSPFNFTAIGGNLTGAPALMGNTVIWKPSDSAVYASYFVYKILEEAGLPPGVINFIPGPPKEVTEVALADPKFAGLHFTGSTEVLRSLWRQSADNLDKYHTYPRIVGETGGKDFIMVHPSAEPQAVLTAIVRGSFEYQGQKCSAASRAYIPESVWKIIKDDLVGTTEGISMGDPADFSNYMGAVIHKNAFTKIMGYIDRARDSADAQILVGGEGDDSEGYFIRPTIIQALKPDYESMREEIFGPVMTVYVYPDGEWSETLTLLDRTSMYGLTGAIFARDRKAIMEAHKALRYAAGNFYVNDKPTGAVVGQQPFGGARASGTNDKAGSPMNLMRWVSPRVVKETFVSELDYRYPFMDSE